MAHPHGDLIRKLLAVAGLSLLLATGMANASPALAQPGSTTQPPETGRSDGVAPLVTGCNGTLPSGWQYRGSYSYCYECRSAGLFWEATGKYRAHCQTYGDGVRLWTQCVVCRTEEATEDRRLVPATEAARVATPEAARATSLGRVTSTVA